MSGQNYPWNKGLKAKDDKRIANSVALAQAALRGKHAWNYNPLFNKCLTCGIKIKTTPARIKEGKGKYCKEHRYDGQRGKSPWNKGLEMLQNRGIDNARWKGGKSKCTDCAKETSSYTYSRCDKCWRKFNAGSNHYEWLGDNVGYFALHDWVEKIAGKASKCSNNITHKSRIYHWANISGEYKRDISDWHELCPKCHKNDKVKMNDRFKK